MNWPAIYALYVLLAWMVCAIAESICAADSGTLVDKQKGRPQGPTLDCPAVSAASPQRTRGVHP